MVISALPPGPFTFRLGFSDNERTEMRSRLDALGVRALPYPFSSAMSVLSDCDASTRERYEAYVEAFIRLGLDFGDSSWLHWDHQTNHNMAGGLGFFSYAYSRGLDHDAAWLARTRTFVESLVAYHAGNIDHFHSLLRDGPRVVIVDCATAEGKAVEILTGAFQVGGAWRTDDLHLFGLLVEGQCGQASVVEEDGTATVFARRLAAPHAGQTLLAAPFDPDGENRAILLRAVHAVTLAEARNVQRIILLSCHSQLLLERIARLRRFNVEMSLITEHSRLHFRAPTQAAKDDQATSERLRGYEGPLPGVYGAISDDEGLVVSTDADDPESVCRVLPDLFELGLRFLVPAANSGFDGLDLLDVVSPTPTRSGGGGYWARRVMPLGLSPYPRAHQDSFTPRMRAALDGADRAPGKAWPMYTHLGALDPIPGRRGPPPAPEPYLDEADMRILQDRALGISGRGARIWFARASVLFDYCLIARTIADHVCREADAINIDSWDDPALGRRLPCSAAQLFGLTFYVDDAATASVSLDGRAIETLARNPVDENGRQSVTILECEIRSALFDRLSPLANYPEEADIAGQCVWRDGELIVDGSVSIPLHGWRAPGAQAFEFTARGVFGVRLRTQAGGSFYFGDPRWKDGSDDASYTFLDRQGGRFVAPFHDLEWRASGGSHLPSHALASIAFMGEARFAKPTFLRPRATTLNRENFCVAGRVPQFEPGQIVNLDDRRETVDQRGWFCFPETPGGIYRLTTVDRCDRRGPMVEIGSDVVNLELNRTL